MGDIAETATVRVLFTGDSSSALRHTGLLGKSFGGLGRAAKLAGVAIAGGIVTSMVAATGAAISYDRALRNLNSIAKLSERELQALSKQVLELAKTTGQGPTVLAEGLYEIVSSGFQAREALDVLRASAKAATAGLTTTDTAAKAISAALNAYHLPASKAAEVSDVLFQTVNKGVLSFEALAQNMGDLVPAAAPLGVSLEEVGAAVATITLQGVPAAEAATRVKNSFLQLASPSKALAGLLKDAGFESGEAAIKAVGFAGVLDLVSKATGGSVTATSKLIPEIRALMGIVGLTGKNAKTYEANLRAMEGASKGAGAASAAFAEQGKSISVQWDKAKARLEAAGISLAARWLPAVAQGIEGVSRFADWLSRNTDEIEGMGRQVVSVAGAFRNDLSASLAGGVAAMALFGAGMSKAIETAKAMRVAILAINPVMGAVALAVGLLTFALIRSKMATDEYAASLDKAKAKLEGMVNAADEARRADLELATARTNLKAANLSVADAERALAQARAGGRQREIARAEVSLEQARNGAKAAALGVQDAEAKATNTSNKLRTSHQQAAKTVAELGQQMRELGQRVGFSNPRLSESAARLKGISDQARQKHVARFSAQMADLARKGYAVAAQLDKTNPKLAQTARNGAEAASTMSALAAAWGRVVSLPSAKAFIARFSVFTTIETTRLNTPNHPQGRREPPRALGGPVAFNQPYLVGERGPELFVPHRSGAIVPNEQLGQRAGPIRVVINAEPGTDAMLRRMIRSVAVEADNEVGRRADRKSRTFSGR